MESNNILSIIPKLWNIKWHEFMEEQKLALLFVANGEHEDFFMNSELVFDGETVFIKHLESSIGISFNSFRKKWQVVSLQNMIIDMSDTLSDIISPFKFGLYQMHMLQSGYHLELEAGLTYTNWKLEDVKLKYAPREKSVELIHKNGETVYILSEEKRRERLRDEISLYRDINAWEKEFQNTLFLYDDDTFENPNPFFFLSKSDICEITGLSKRKVTSIVKHNGEWLNPYDSIYLLKRFGTEEKYLEFLVPNLGGLPSVLLDKSNLVEIKYGDYYFYVEETKLEKSA